MWWMPREYEPTLTGLEGSEFKRFRCKPIRFDPLAVVAPPALSGQGASHMHGSRPPFDDAVVYARRFEISE